MKRIDLFITSGILIMLVIIGLIFWFQDPIFDENRMYWNDIKALKEQSQQIHTLEGQLAAQTRVLQFSSNELKELYPELVKEINNLKVKVNKVQSISSIPFEINKDIHTILRDSILYDTLKVSVLEYEDTFYRIHGIISGGKETLKIQYRDTSTQVVFRGEREKPWLWIFSKRKLQQRISLKNPDAIISFPSYIQIED